MASPALNINQIWFNSVIEGGGWLFIVIILSGVFWDWSYGCAVTIFLAEKQLSIVFNIVSDDSVKMKMIYCMSHRKGFSLRRGNLIGRSCLSLRWMFCHQFCNFSKRHVLRLWVPKTHFGGSTNCKQLIVQGKNSKAGIFKIRFHRKNSYSSELTAFTFILFHFYPLIFTKNLLRIQSYFSKVLAIIINVILTRLES